MPHSTRRGFVSGDAEDFGEAALPRLREAQKHIHYLLDHGYGLESSVNFTGNRFQFSSRQRLALLRSTCTSKAMAGRSDRMLHSCAGEDAAYIDGFNTIITLEAAISEETTLLRCMDGAIRDLCGVHGNYCVIESTARAIRWIISGLRQAGARRAVFYLDAPVSNSGKLAGMIRELTAREAFPAEVYPTPNSDTALFDRPNVVSSDAVVMDRCRSWLSLAENIIAEQLPERRFVDLCSPLRAAALPRPRDAAR